MNIKIQDIMKHPAVTTQGHKSVGHVKEIMTKNKIHSVPIENSEGGVAGIVTANDFLIDTSDNSPISQIMQKEVLTVPLYSDVHVAARIMRNHKTHHLVVTDEKKIVGVISSFDLLRLIEEHRFAVKNAPSSSNKKSKRA